MTPEEMPSQGVVYCQKCGHVWLGDWGGTCAFDGCDERLGPRLPEPEGEERDAGDG